MNVSEIRGVAIDTVKTQAKAVYAKTGVLNRAQLVRKIVSPLRPRLSEQMMRQCAI